jgi:hypothetical protein
MVDPSNGKRAGINAMPQHEANARLLREKTAHLRELRLTREAAIDAVSSPAVASGHKTIKKRGGKAREKGLSLSDWLAAQQNEGRRG